MGCGGIQPRETDFVGRAWCGRGLRDRHPSTTRPTARSLPLGARATGRQGGASTPSRSHSPRTSSARLVDRTATGATRPWRRQRATASRPLAGPRPARTLTNSPRDPSSCTSDGPLISCRDRAPAAVTVAREPTAASSQPKGCAPTPHLGASTGGPRRAQPEFLHQHIGRGGEEDAQLIRPEATAAGPTDLEPRDRRPRSECSPGQTSVATCGPGASPEGPERRTAQPLTRLACGFRRAGMRLIWGGRASVRAALYIGALVATRYNPLIQRFYYRLVAAGKPKKLALTACMRKLITILNAMVRSNSAWQHGLVSSTPELA